MNDFRSSKNVLYVIVLINFENNTRPWSCHIAFICMVRSTCLQTVHTMYNDQYNVLRILYVTVCAMLEMRFHKLVTTCTVTIYCIYGADIKSNQTLSRNFTDSTKRRIKVFHFKHCKLALCNRRANYEQMPQKCIY